jgi:hypothetical protein
LPRDLIERGLHPCEIEKAQRSASPDWRLAHFSSVLRS